MSEMELQDPECWDFERAVKMQPVKKPRAVVSVVFSGQDFEAVARAAELLDMNLSEFIRHAALERATGRASR